MWLCVLVYAMAHIKLSSQKRPKCLLLSMTMLWCLNAALAAQDFSELLKTIEIFYYSPFYHEEQQVRKNVKLDGFIDNVEIKVLIHGYVSSRYHISIEPIKQAYLSAGNVNLMIVDWSQASYQLYDVSRRVTTQVASRIAQMLDDFLRENGINGSSVHLIGHSLGAHIAGNIGRMMTERVGRITGLDPAAPLYLKSSYDAIKPSDAPFVDIVHTNGERLGATWAKGHCDFFPNYGVVTQPGCELRDVVTLFSCSHFRAVEYYAESILNPNAFIAVPCSMSDILAQRYCAAKSKSAQPAIMGEYASRKTRGTYFLQTNSVAPYGKSNYSGLYV